MGCHSKSLLQNRNKYFSRTLGSTLGCPDLTDFLLSSSITTQLLLWNAFGPVAHSLSKGTSDYSALYDVANYLLPETASKMLAICVAIGNLDLSCAQNRYSPLPNDSMRRLGIESKFEKVAFYSSKFMFIR